MWPCGMTCRAAHDSCPQLFTTTRTCHAVTTAVHTLQHSDWFTHAQSLRLHCCDPIQSPHMLAQRAVDQCQCNRVVTQRPMVQPLLPIKDGAACTQSTVVLSLTRADLSLTMLEQARTQSVSLPATLPVSHTTSSDDEKLLARAACTW
jgi:hypothetical protein